jgi:FkbM family methyltransferase
MLKSVLLSFLRAQGYDLIRSECSGRDPWTALSNLFKGKPPKLILDIGANEGQTATRLAAVFPSATIYSFEPFEGAFQSLAGVAAQTRQIRPIRSAVGESGGFMTLNLSTASVTNSLLPTAPEFGSFQAKGWAVPRGTATVAVTTIDTFCRDYGIRGIDLLKTDTQGYEMSVLRGAQDLMLQERITSVLVEMTFVPLYVGQASFQDIYGCLWQHGFRLVHLYNVNTNKWKYASWCDALFVHPNVLARRQDSNAEVWPQT